MFRQIIFGTLLSTSLLFVGCTQQSPQSPSPDDHAGAPVVSLEAPPILFNAYTAKTLDADHHAGTPANTFLAADKVYVGVVIHGSAASAAVKVKWSLVDEPAVTSEEVAVPVAGSAVATIELSKSAPLTAGSYKAIVLLNGKPNWELNFKVGE